MTIGRKMVVFAHRTKQTDMPNIKITEMNPAFVTLVAHISTRDQIPFDQALVVAGNELAKISLNNK